MSIIGIWQLKKMAFRNLMRHKVKTILTSLAITISVALYIFLNSWLGGMQIESRRNIVNYEIGAAKLQTKLYFERKDEMPSFENFKNWEVYRDALEREGYNSAPRYVFTGTLFSASGSAPILFHGVDPAAEALTLRYIGENEKYIDFGRYVQNGSFEIALGTIAAEKLKVGIPSRPLKSELEELISVAAANAAEADFIRSLYEEAPPPGMWDFNVEIIPGNERLILKRSASKADLDRYWALVDAAGRNDVRINAVIDMRAVPEIIRADRFEVELMEALRPQDKQLVQDAYEYVEIMGGYLLKEELETDENQLNAVLNAMIRAGFTGAVRHVNQVFDVKVVGVINCPAPLPNANTAYIPLDVLQDEAGMMLQGAVTELVIRDSRVADHQLPGESESAAAITAALERGLGYPLPDDLAVHTWDEHMADYLGYEQIQLGAPQVIIFLLVIICFFGISNTILMAIMERSKETGMFRAMGMTDGQLVMMYMLEAGFIGVIGSVLGIALGCLINYPMVTTGMDFSAMAATMGDGSVGFRTTGLFLSTWNIGVIITAGIAAPILSALVAIFPTRKALKTAITENLRFE